MLLEKVTFFISRKDPVKITIMYLTKSYKAPSQNLSLTKIKFCFVKIRSALQYINSYWKRSHFSLVGKDPVKGTCPKLNHLSSTYYYQIMLKISTNHEQIMHHHLSFLHHKFKFKNSCCNAGPTGRPVLYTEPKNRPRVNIRKKKKKKKYWPPFQNLPTRSWCKWGNSCHINRQHPSRGRNT